MSTDLTDHWLPQILADDIPESAQGVFDPEARHRELRSFALSSDGSRIYAGYWNDSVWAWDLSQGAALWNTHGGGPRSSVGAVAMGEDGRLAVAHSDGHVRCLDPNTGAQRNQLSGGGPEIESLCFSPAGAKRFPLLAGGAADASIHFWNPDRRGLLARLSGHTRFVGHSAAVKSLAMSGDGILLASGDDDGFLRLWDMSSGKTIWEVKAHANGVRSIDIAPAESPTTGLLATSEGFRKPCICLWDIDSGDEFRRLRGHKHSVNSVRFSPDGGLLATGSDDGTVRIWDPLAGTSLLHTDHLTGYVSDVAWAPDGSFLAVGVNRVGIRLLETRSIRPVSRKSHRRGNL